MRNLKKILALVLALVMSLSLMAVASADEELNLGDVSEVYAESVDVLTGLKVFMGNKGEFLPKDNITRAEVAAIIYRIVTGDVNDIQKAIYADYNKFSDVTSDAWYAGYVNYCANAEYVKGVGGGKFNPQGNVTGYEALAMILRAIGYDKNNEFTGSNWQIQTAATARNRGILENIAEGTLGGPATREVVAEILCKTILVPVADYTLAFGYRTTDANGKDNENLAYKTFKMEKLTGVVTANEYADLESATPVGAGQTTLKLMDSDMKVLTEKRTLNVASDLDDLGESRYVYVIPQSGTTRYDLVCSKVYDTDMNNVYDSYDEVASVSGTTGKDDGINSIVGATHLRNYGELITDSSDWRIEYVIKMGVCEYDAKTMFRDNGNKDNSTLKYIGINPSNDTYATEQDVDIPYSSVKDNDGRNWNRSYSATADGTYNYEYRKVINVGSEITAADRANIETIFTKSTHILAGNTQINTAAIIGEVYVGTSTREGRDDISNKISYNEFVETYLKDKVGTVANNGLGHRLKIVDNNNDGVAEYVLQTVYTAAMVSGVDANGKISLDIANAKFDSLIDANNVNCHKAHDVAPRWDHDIDNCNQITSSTSVKVYGDDEVATGNVVLYALIDGTAQIELAATETAKFDKVDRAAKTATVTGEGGATYNESAVHEHSTALTHTVQNLVTNTTYTLYFDKAGNLAAFTEGTNGGLVLITNGWYNVQKGGTEYAVRAWIDGSLQTVDVTGNGELFITGKDHTDALNNNWNQIRDLSINNGGHNVHTAVVQLQDGVLVPVDKAYYYSRQYSMLDMRNNTIPGRDNISASKGWVYNTNYLNGIAYNEGTRTDANLYDVRGLSSTTYYYVYNYYRNSSDPTTLYNTVVREYVGYSNIPNVPASAIEDVYAVGTRVSNAVNQTYYTADVVVVELNSTYTLTDSEQVFVPGFYLSMDNLGRETVHMIRGDGTEADLVVDMKNSQLRGYDPVGSNGVAGYNNVRYGAGLYFLDESDTEKGVYILREMTQADIQRNNYAVGLVNKNYATSNENWTSVDLFTWDGVRNSYNVDGILPWTNADGAAINSTPIEVSKRHTDNSKYYSLSYNSYANATLTPIADRQTALVQNPDEAKSAAPTKPAWVNEAVIAPYVTRNEVLVRYDDSNNIIYTVSFAEWDGTDRNIAQTVWFRNMPQSYAQVAGYDPTVTLHTYAEGHGADATNDIVVTYTEAMNVATNNRNIVVTPGANDGAVNSAITSVTKVTTTLVDGVPTKETETFTTPSNVNGQYIIPVPVEVNGVTYEISVVYPLSNGTNVNKTFILRQEAAGNTSELKGQTAADAALIGVDGLISLPREETGATESIEKFVSRFYATNLGKLVWEITVDGESYSYTSGGELPAGLKGKSTGSISAFTVSVLNERNVLQAGQDYFGGRNDDVMVAAAKKTVTKAVEAVDGYEEYKNDPAVIAAYNSIQSSMSGKTAAQILALKASAVEQMKNAIASLKTTKLTVDASVTTEFTSGVTYNGNAYLSCNTINNVPESITLTVANLKDDATYIFWAERNGKKTAEASIVCVNDTDAPDTYSVTLTGISQGTWTLKCEKLETAQPVSWTMATDENSLPSSAVAGGLVYEVKDGAEDRSQNLLDIGSKTMSRGQSVTFTATAPATHVVADVLYKVGSAGRFISIPAVDGKYTFTNKNVDDTVTIVVKVETVATAEAAAEEAATLSTAMNSAFASTTNDQLKSAMAAMASAKNSVDLAKAEAEAKNALGLPATAKLLAATPDELPATGTLGAVDNAVARPCLSGGVVVAYDASATGGAKKFTLYGTPDKMFDSTELEPTSEAATALRRIWYTDPSTEDNTIIASIFRAIKAGGDDNEWDEPSEEVRETVAKFGYICIPSNNGEYSGDDWWMMICVTANGTKFIDNRYATLVDYSNITF